VLMNDPHSPDSPRQLELQVLACKPWLGAHHVRTRILHRQAPSHFLKAA